MTFSGTCVDPFEWERKKIDLKETFTIVDDKNQMMTMYGPGPDGAEFKMMEIRMSRK
ncbi:MAG: DUF1579 domain-containing protein [Chitinophagaceae bacterium]|nr:MAG: DUF1579 domain-containing protein [Chitinophagaceae bacterium]